MPASELTIPCIPVEVDVRDLKINNKLFSDAEISNIRKAISSDGRFREIDIAGKRVRLRYAVVAQDDRLFAVYSGKHLLGKGGYGKVKLLQDLISGEWLPFKIRKIDSQYFTGDDLDQIEHEEKMLSYLDEIIVTGANARPLAFSRKSAQKRCEQHYMAMQFAQGEELFNVASDVRSGERKISFGQLIKIIINAIQAVQKAHDRHVLHRDIKPDNFRVNLVNESVKLVDYGFAVKTDDSFGFDDSCERVFGTVGYIPDEVYQSHWYDEKSEIYALGCTIGLMLGLANQSEISADNEIYLVDYKTVGSIPFNLDPEHIPILASIYGFLTRMMHHDPVERPAIAEAFGFFNGTFKLLPDMYKVVNVGLLDVGDYLAAKSDARRKDHVMRILRRMDQVWLVDQRAQTDMSSNAILKQELERSGLQVLDKIYVGASKSELLATLPRQFAGDANSLHYVFQDLTVPRSSGLMQRFTASMARLFSRPAANPGMAASAVELQPVAVVAPPTPFMFK